LWREVEAQTLKTLPVFLERLAAMAAESRDYDTRIRAVAMGGAAASYAMEATPHMGMSGASASMVMWEYMLNYGHVTLPATIVGYRDMLYPQYARYFEKTITRKAFVLLQEIAAEELMGDNLGPDVREHMESIVDGEAPFGYGIRD